MLLFGGPFGLLMVGVWIYCIIDVITTPEDQCRNLPKIAWLLIVLLFFDIGAIVWLVAGRNWNRAPANMPYKGNRGMAAAPPARRATNPDDDEEFQAKLRARVEEQRRRARDAKRHEDPPPTA